MDAAGLLIHERVEIYNRPVGLSFLARLEVGRPRERQHTWASPTVDPSRRAATAAARASGPKINGDYR
jgi:hypothetical protein